MIFVLLELLKNDIYFTYFNKLPDNVIYLMVTIFLIVFYTGRALLFKKAGVKPEYAFIPVYGTYRYYEIFWRGKYGLIELILTNMFYMLVPRDQRLLNAGLIGYFCLIIYIIKFVIFVIGQLKLSKSFGKNIAYVVGLVVMEAIFVLLIAIDKSKYLGPTLREYNSKTLLDYHNLIKHKNGSGHKTYLINLHRWRSTIALIVCVISIVMAIFALSENMIEDVRKNEIGDFLKFFTVFSNILTVFAAACIVPYAIDGIKKKRFSYPKWVNLLHYSGTICTTITMVFAVLIISQYNPAMAFGKYNTIYHVVCPIAILAAFMLVESGYKLSINESVGCLFPFALYAIIYTVEVFLIGEENGGWPDIYKFITFSPVSFSLPSMLMLALAVSLGIGRIYNMLSDYRKRKLKEKWSRHSSSVEVKIEAYGLGRYMGMHEDDNNAYLPLDILSDLASFYDIRLEELIRAYTKGIVDGNSEKGIYNKFRYTDLSALVGTPYYLSEAYRVKNNN